MKSDRAPQIGTLLSAAALAACVFQGLFAASASADPFKLGAESTQVIQGATGSYEYPAPQMMGTQSPMQASVRSNAPMNLGASMQRQNSPPPRQFRMQTQQQVQLPQGYLGVWLVQGRRTTVDAIPEFQNDADRAFATQTQNQWQISGSPGAYTMGNGQISTALIVDRVGPDGTAFIRYAHPMGRNGATSAQEAIVLSLQNGGMRFSGLERVSIVKNGGPPRAKITYELMGQRQR
jgi:hypothetical protein